MSEQPTVGGPAAANEPAGPAAGDPPAALRCPRCSAEIAPDQDWCVECGAAARTRLAGTPNWRLPTIAVAAVVAVAGALLAFAFVQLTEDPGGVTPAGTAPVAGDVAPAPEPAAPAPTSTLATPTATTTVPADPAAPPATVPGQGAPPAGTATPAPGAAPTATQPPTGGAQAP